MPAATPRYQRVIDDIKRLIDSGELEPGARLPSTRELMARYGVSNTVIRSAMLILKNEGYVEGEQGLGVFVRGQD